MTYELLTAAIVLGLPTAVKLTQKCLACYTISEVARFTGRKGLVGTILGSCKRQPD